MEKLLSSIEIKEILEAHKKWLETEGKAGEQANFRRKNLTGIDFSNVNLTKADLRKAILYKANLSNAKLGGALLSNADLSNANLSFAELSNATFSHSNLSYANLSNISARATNFRNAIFFKANLSNSFLNTSACICANFTEANLSKSDIRRAKFDRANLTKANLYFSDLRQANFGLSNLTSANLTGVRIWEIQNAEWNIKNSICDYLYIDKEAKKRIPENRNFDINEFQEIYGTYPSIEYFFKNGFTPIDPILLSRIIHIINVEHPETNFQLESLSLTGQNPTAKFRVSSYEKAKEVLNIFIIKYELLKKQLSEQKYITIQLEVNKMDIKNFTMNGNNNGIIGDNGIINNISNKPITREEALKLIELINDENEKDVLEGEVISTIKDELQNVAIGVTKEISLSSFDALKKIVIEKGCEIFPNLFQ